MQDERNLGGGSGSAGLGSTGGTGSSGTGAFGSAGGAGSSASSASTAGASTSGGSTGSSAGGANRLGGLDQLQSTLGDLEQRADQFMDQAAEQLENAADQLGSIADRVPQRGVGARAGALGHSTADTLDAVARFLRDNDTATLQRELGTIISNRPLSTLLLAVGAGFVVGKVLR